MAHGPLFSVGVIWMIIFYQKEGLTVVLAVYTNIQMTGSLKKGAHNVGMCEASSSHVRA